MNKTSPSLADAVSDIPDGVQLMIGGFGGSGAPIELIHALIAFAPPAAPRILQLSTITRETARSESPR